jgi:hypothetical protein
MGGTGTSLIDQGVYNGQDGQDGQGSDLKDAGGRVGGRKAI